MTEIQGPQHPMPRRTQMAGRYLFQLQSPVVAHGTQHHPEVAGVAFPVVGFHEVQVHKSLSGQFVLLGIKMLWENNPKFLF